MIHEALGRKAATEASTDRSFGFVFSAVFAIVALWPLLYGGNVRWWAVVASAALVIIAIFFPRMLRPANVLWTHFGALLHSIVSPVVLGFMYFVVITPLGLLMRALGKNPLALKYDRKADSYWIERTLADEQLSSMKNQF